MIPKMLISDATFSADRVYRYKLRRIWDWDRPLVCFNMLNPSTADERKNDPTVTRCIGFAYGWGFGGLIVVNAFAYRATDPRELKRAHDKGVFIIGKDNARVIFDAANACDLIVCAWGTGGKLFDRGPDVTKFLVDEGFKPKCLGVTKGGHPKHPLYIPKRKKLIEWPTEARNV